MPLRLEYPEEEERAEEPPAPSTGTSSTATTSAKTKRGRGQHRGHKKHDDVHVIAQVGPQGEPLQPIEIISRFSNPCSCIVREKVPITYENWKLVPKDLKGVVWGEMMRRFTYPDGSNLDKCEAHVMYLAGKVLRNFIYRRNREYVQTGKNPCARYNYVLPEVWEAFVKQKQTPEAKAKWEQFSELAKRN